MRTAADRAYACVNCQKDSSGSERANYDFTRSGSAPRRKWPMTEPPWPSIRRKAAILAENT